MEKLEERSLNKSAVDGIKVIHLSMEMPHSSSNKLENERMNEHVQAKVTFLDDPRRYHDSHYFCSHT